MALAAYLDNVVHHDLEGMNVEEDEIDDHPAILPIPSSQGYEDIYRLRMAQDRRVVS